MFKEGAIRIPPNDKFGVDHLLLKFNPLKKKLKNYILYIMKNKLIYLLNEYEQRTDL